MASKKQKNIVLFALFIAPLIFYIFLQLGTHNFGKLPKISKEVLDISLIDNNYTFKNKISVIVFIGDNVSLAEGAIFNVNEKVYKKFYGYTDFQMIGLVVKGQEAEIKKITKKLSINTNMVKWNFIYASKEELNAIYDSLKTTERLNENAFSSKAYIIDKENNLRRGKSSIKSLEDKKLFGYNMKSIAELKNDMHDDVKVVLAEYSFALKKNNNNSEDRRKKSISNEKN